MARLSAGGLTGTTLKALCSFLRSTGGEDRHTCNPFHNLSSGTQGKENSVSSVPPSPPTAGVGEWDSPGCQQQFSRRARGSFAGSDAAEKSSHAQIRRAWGHGETPLLQALEPPRSHQKKRRTAAVHGAERTHLTHSRDPPLQPQPVSCKQPLGGLTA